MSTFFEQLWQSIFTPGTTPTLLVATNASFAALQVLLFIMLLATYSIHFIILSMLCGGLWWSINWFAAEIRAAQAKEEEAKRIREARRDSKEKARPDDDGEAMDSGDDTEVDAEIGKKQRKPPKPKRSRSIRKETQSAVFVERPSEREGTPRASATGRAHGTSAINTAGDTTRLAPLVDSTLKKRALMGESTGDLSTDSEWEKLSQDSGDR